MNRIRISPVSTLVCFCGGITLLAAFYLSRGTPEAGARTRALESRIAERDRTITELRHRQKSHGEPDGSAENPTFLQRSDSGASHPRNIGSETAQERIEAVFRRIEQRFARLENQMKEARLVPRTRQEHEAELRSATETLAGLRKRLNTQFDEVRRLATALNVPEEVTKLSPHKALHDPNYKIYGAYFAAKISAEGTQALVTASEDSIARFEIQGSDSP